jgi:hypothetical protein
MLLLEHCCFHHGGLRRRAFGELDELRDVLTVVDVQFGINTLASCSIDKITVDVSRDGVDAVVAGWFNPVGGAKHTVPGTETVRRCRQWVVSHLRSVELQRGCRWCTRSDLELRVAWGGDIGALTRMRSIHDKSDTYAIVMDHPLDIR